MLPKAVKNFERWDLKSVRPPTLSLKGESCLYSMPDAVITVQAIRNITFTNLHKFVWTFSKFIKNYEFRVQSSLANSHTNL